MRKKYSIIHSHTMLSNGITNVDSVTRYSDYIKEITSNKSLGINGICFTEHGSTFEWYKKKCECEKNGLKYVHSVEMYVTEHLNDKIRDNYHVCLFATNKKSFEELNVLISKASNREDGHYYYVPRITFDELTQTSSDILVSTACIGGILGKGNDNIKTKFIDFLVENKNRCYLEVQHHLVSDQIEYNKYIYKIHKKYNIPMVVATDTHALNEKHAKGRSILQKSKGIFFSDEGGWDITLKSYEELVSLFEKQKVISSDDIYNALENTNRLYDRVEEFDIDKTYKYPKSKGDSLQELKNKINAGVIKRGVNKYDNYKSEYIPRIHNELKTYIHNGAVDFLLLDEDIKTEMAKKDIFSGYSRGSCSGSIIAYLIGMTEIDSIEHKMNFERFMNIERVSLADVDTDWQPNHREIVKDYIYGKKDLYCADIITFNTVALKGSIRDVCKALYKKEWTKEISERSKSDSEGYGMHTDGTMQLIKEHDREYLEISTYICENVEDNESKMRKEYPNVFEYVDIINGTIVSIGTHPCGTICSPIPLDSSIGLCSISTCSHPVSMISMKSVDEQNFVKLDILGLDNIQLINETCKLANIERLTPKNTPDEEEVWLDMGKDNTLIFQWESDSAGDFIKTLLSEKTLNKIKKVNPNFKYIDLVSMGNGAIRPAGSSYRDALANGEFRDNGHEALNKLLSSTSGFLVYQEQILAFLNQFCGYTMGEADIVRRGFAKKTGTEQFIPKIKLGFTKTMKNKYGVSEKESDELIVNFIDIIISASEYLFSENHSVPYTYIGYIGAYLRYYHPLEFITTALNINKDKEDKTNSIVEYAKEKGIKISSPKFGYAKSEYFMSKDTNSIYKGIASIKNLNSKVADELYDLSQNNNYKNFNDLLIDIKEKTSCNSRQLDILVRIDYFDVFGKSKKLLKFIEMFNLLYGKKSPSKSTMSAKIDDLNIIKLIELNSTPTDKTYTKFNSLPCLESIWSVIPNTDVSLATKIVEMKELLGYLDYTNPKLDKRYVIITDLNEKYTPTVQTTSLGSGNSVKCKISKTIFKNNPLQVNDIVYIHSMELKEGFKKVGEKELKNGKTKPIFEVDPNAPKSWWITSYSKLGTDNLDEALED